MRFSPSLVLLAALVAPLALTGCEDEVDPTLGIDAPFSLYGYLDPTADRQAIRVVPIQDRIDAPLDTIDATVTSTDLETGETTAWRDSVVTYGDGTVGHVFVADLSPRPGTTVRVEAKRSDGVMSTVEVAVPPIVQATVSPARSFPGEVTYPVEFEGAPRVLIGQFRLVIKNVPGRDADDVVTLTVPLQTVPTETSPDVWVVEVPFVSSARAVLEAEGLRNRGVRLIAAAYIGFVANEAWDPPSDDPDALVEPGTFSNVEGGLGFLGAGYFAATQWLPSNGAQQGAGFATDLSPATSVRINEIAYSQDGVDGWVEFYNPQPNDFDLFGFSITDTGLEPRKQTFPFGVVVPAQGFKVVPLTFFLNPGVDPPDTPFEIALYDRSSELISRVVLRKFLPLATGTPPTYGSYPDGHSFQLPQGGPDIFRGALRPTPGQPNELGLDVASINEVYTEGTLGWVEAVPLGYNASLLRLFNDPEGFYDGVFPQGTPFAVSDEVPGTFDLAQGGGTLFLLAQYDDARILRPQGPKGQPPPPRAPEFRVVDARQYGGQTAGRSVGYLPDAPDGTWTLGLRPTRGAPNAAARLGL